MKIIGITGGVGCGKTMATTYIQEKGFPVVDADLIVKELFTNQAVQNQIQAKLQTLDKKKLREEIFSSPEKRKLLENILHPKVIERIQFEIMNHRRSNHEILFVSIPLLFEKKLHSMFDSIVAIVCNSSNQQSRLQNRDSMTEEMTKAMIASQWTSEEKAKNAHHVVHNDGTIDELHEKIDSILQRLTN